MIKLFDLLILMLISTTISFSKQKVEAEVLFKEANEFFEQGDYDHAIYAYNQLINNKLSDCKIYCNLGNAYFKRKKYDSAFIAFHNAFKLKSGHSGYHRNLLITYFKLNHSAYEIEYYKIQTAYFFNYFSMSQKLLVLFILLNVIVFVKLYMKASGSQQLTCKILIWGFIVTIGFTLTGVILNFFL